MRGTQSPRRVVRFGVFDLDLGVHELRRNGVRVKLQEQPFQVLALLVESGGELVTREELRQKLWPSDTFVDFDLGLNTAVKKLREALGDSADSPRFVETVPRLGYRFIAPILQPNSLEVVELQAKTAGELTSEVAAQTRFARWGRGALLILFGVAILGGAAYFVHSTFGLRTHTQRGRTMLAVLPFENLGSDASQEYFSDGLTEETITDLGEMDPERLGVIARTSIMAYKGKKQTIEQIGRELGVDYILEGSVRREGERVRISAQLISVKDQTHLWAHSYDSTIREFLLLQGQMGQAIAHAVQLKLTPEQKTHLDDRPAVNADAYDAYLRGRYSLNQLTTTAIRTGIEFFEQAIRIAPQTALPYSGLAYAYATLPITSDVPSRESFPEAKGAASRAIALDNRLAEAHVALCAVHFWYDWDWAGAEDECCQAISLNSSYAIARFRYAHVLSNEGRHPEAIQEIERARLLDPYSPAMNTFKGFFLYQARQYDRAIEQLQHAVDLNPAFWIAHINLCKAYEQKQQFEKAIAECSSAWELSGGNTETISLTGHIHATQGKRIEAQRKLEELLGLSKTKYVPPYNVALIWAGLGQNDKAMEWLEKASQDRDVHLVFLLVDPKWDAFRTNPRFLALLRRCNLAATALPTS